MTFLAIVAACKASLVAGHTVLVCLNAAGFAMTITSQLDELVGQVKNRVLLLPAQGQVRSRNYLDKVHEVISLLFCLMLCIIKWVEMMVSPSHALLANASNNIIRQLRTKAKMMDIVGESMFDVIAASPVVLEIVNVHVTVAERLARCKVEIANNLVDTNSTFNTAAFSTLFV